jgi:predicted phage tail protein
MDASMVAWITVPGMFCWFAFMIFSTIRRYKIAKAQADVQTKLLDKVGSGQELLAYAQTATGQQLLESLKVERISPHGRIIGAVQAGIVFVFLGGALLILRYQISGADQGFAILGTLSCALGAGFILSAAASYFLSKSLGLLNGAANHR